MVIIAVDDERLAVESIIKSIRSVAPGAEVYGFRSGVSALDFLESHPVDVAFLDIEMRDMNGMDLAAQIRRRFPRMNIVFTEMSWKICDIRSGISPAAAGRIRAADLKRQKYQNSRNVKVLLRTAGRP